MLVLLRSGAGIHGTGKPAASAVYALMYALTRHALQNPYKPGITASSSNDAWAPYKVARKPQILGSGAFLWVTVNQFRAGTRHRSSADHALRHTTQRQGR